MMLRIRALLPPQCREWWPPIIGGRPDEDSRPAQERADLAAQGLDARFVDPTRPAALVR
jgi:hypothetical protein